MIIPLFKLVKVKLKAILFLGLLFVAMVIQAQEKLTLNSFLSSTIDSNLVDQDSTTITLLSSKNYNIPLIKSTQFRLETRRFIETFQEFSVRIKPNNFREISSQKNIYANKIQEVRLENKIKINESLKNRYLLALDYIFNKKTAIEKFDLNNVLPNPAIFDTKKLLWMNGQYIRDIKDGEFKKLFIESIQDSISRELFEQEQERFL